MVPRIAVLGCGYWGSKHIHTLSKLGALYIVCDSDIEKAKKLAEHYVVNYTTVDDLFSRNDVDAIVLAIPPEFNAQYAIRTLENNKDVFVEKPMALIIADAEQIIKVAKKNSRVLMVGHLLQFHPAFEKLVDLVHNKFLGKVRFVYSQRLGIGKFHNKSDALWDLAPHDISMILTLIGCKPATMKIEDINLIDTMADFSCLHMSFPGGVRSHVTVSRLNPYRERRLTVIGSKAMAVFDDLQSWEKKLSIYLLQENSQYQFNGPEYISIIEDLPLKRALQHFLHCIETREEARINGDEGICVLKVLTAINEERSALSKRMKG